jgi:inhibitor of KinA sporulation pathway (predicted exonuclease)
VPYPFGTGHVNVKSLLAVTYGLRKEVGLARAMEHLRLPLEGTHHRGSDDAWNVAAVLWRIIHSARPALRKARSG